HISLSSHFFFNAPATTDLYTLSLHDALPILLETVALEDLAAVLARYEARELVLPGGTPAPLPLPSAVRTEREAWEFDPELGRIRSEEHTSELQSRGHLVCRLLLEKKKKQ